MDATAGLTVHYLTFDLGVKVTRNVAQYPLHHVTYAATKFEVATFNGLGRDTFTRNMTDGRQTDFGTKIIYSFFLKKKAGIIIKFLLNSLKGNLCIHILYISYNLCTLAISKDLNEIKNKKWHLIRVSTVC